MKTIKTYSNLIIILICMIIYTRTIDSNISPLQFVCYSQAQIDLSPLSQDIIIKKYRVYNGRIQYRRWNDTKKIWYDPFWIDV